MTPPALTAVRRELPALIEQISATLPADESRALAESLRAYVGKGAILEITSRPDETSAIDENMVRDWRTPLRLLLIVHPDSDVAADRAYDDWVHWIAGGGLLALRNTDHLYRRAVAGGKFRDLGTTGRLQILQRTAACG
ncbi:hypothetical protein ACFXHA_09875 [Nocardia sp. NPDC059240]|uniref:hypothetical protein n=1 Tax=Nocardia sp. NPDC059240 TaxID=3346786 RepID=UPI00368A65E6